MAVGQPFKDTSGGTNYTQQVYYDSAVASVQDQHGAGHAPKDSIRSSSTFLGRSSEVIRYNSTEGKRQDHMNPSHNCDIAAGQLASDLTEEER